MAVPAGLALAALSFHIVYASGLDKLLVELLVAADAVVHNDLVGHALCLDGLMLAVGDEISNMLHAVNTFEGIVCGDIVVGHMTVVTGHITTMGRMAPRGIVR